MRDVPTLFGSFWALIWSLVTDLGSTMDPNGILGDLGSTMDPDG